MEEKNITYQFVPLHIYQYNAAERAIRSFKNHFLSGLAMADSNFPIRLWDTLLQQAEITLNLMRTSRLNPLMSAYCQLGGPFDYNSTPMTPPGCRVIIHQKSSQRASWAPDGIGGWYTGPAMHHYRCYTCISEKSGATLVADTMLFYPQKTNLSMITPQEKIHFALNDIADTLKIPKNHLTTETFGDSQLSALQ